MNVHWNADGRLVVAGITAEMGHELVRCLDVADRWTWVDVEVKELRNQLADRLMRGISGKDERPASAPREDQTDGA